MSAAGRHSGVVVLLGIVIAFGALGFSSALAEDGTVAASGGPEPAERYDPVTLERYVDCMERNDLEKIQQILWYHKNVARIDASIYGLPKDDFDDQQLLTINERLSYRALRIQENNALPTSGPIQYPHHLRETLDHYYETTGQRPDCSAILDRGALPPGLGLGTGWASDKNLTASDSTDRGEVNIVVDYATPSRVIATSVAGTGTSDNSWRSTDWGATFVQGNVGNNSGSVWECDPVSYYQRSTGAVYHSKIGCNTGSCGQTYVLMRKSTNNGSTWADCGRPTTATNSDRQWHVVDNAPASPCYGNIYVTWHDANTEKVARSTDNCSTFTSLTSVSSASSAITPDINVAADGHVYVVWGNFGDSTFKVAGSSDCGATWNSPSKTTVKSYGGEWSNNIPAQCVRGVATQPFVDVDRCSWSSYKNRVYVVMNDYNTTGTDLGCSPTYNNSRNYDLFFSYSTNNGSTWTSPVNLTSGQGSAVDDFGAFMRVDETDGSIYVGYHRSQLNPASLADRQKTSYVIIRSTNGGSTWSSPFTASTVLGNERNGGASSFERGDYQGVDVYQGVVWPVWVDRRGGTTEEEVVTRKVCTEPSHKSERAPSFTAPPTNASAGASQVINVTWTLPDIFWGDAGENPAARKFQLYVDGALYQDNISSTATSASYTASNCTTPHTFRIRAINQCGIYKDYATSASITATGCSGTADFTLSVSPTSVSASQGGSAQATVSTTVQNGFNSSVSLSLSGLPSGASATFSPNPIAAPGSGSSMLTISTGSAAAGTYNLTITATGGGKTHTTPLTLTINAVSPADFTISVSPTSVSAVQGGSTQATVSTTVQNGFNASISLTVSGLPAGATGSFNPSSIPAPGSGSSTLTIATGTAAAGTYSLTVAGNGGGKTHSVPLTLTITASGGGYPESAHPYANSMDQTWTYTLTGSPSSINVTFDSQTKVESNYDYIYVMDKNGANINGSPFTSTSLAGATKSVTGDTVKIRLTSDYSVTYYGFKVTNVTAGGGGGSQQLLQDPSFELGSTAWTASSGVITNASQQAAHTGSWKAWLDGYGSAHTDSVYQDAAIASTVTSATLSFWLHIDTAETGGTAYDTLKVQLRDTSNNVLTTLATYSNVNAATGYTQKSFNVLSWKGRTVRVYLLGVEDGSLQTSFVADDFALTVQ